MSQEDGFGGDSNQNYFKFTCSEEVAHKKTKLLSTFHEQGTAPIMVQMKISFQSSAPCASIGAAHPRNLIRYNEEIKCHQENINQEDTEKSL